MNNGNRAELEEDLTVDNALGRMDAIIEESPGESNEEAKKTLLEGEQGGTSLTEKDAGVFSEGEDPAMQKPAPSKGGKMKRKILCVEAGIIYESLSGAAKALKIHTSGISAVLAGRTKTAGGYHWEYAVEENLWKYRMAEGDNTPGRARGKRVVCVEDGKIFTSGTEAAKAVGVSQSSISAALAGRIKTAGGYHWKYADLEAEKPQDCSLERGEGRAEMESFSGIPLPEYPSCEAAAAEAGRALKAGENAGGLTADGKNAGIKAEVISSESASGGSHTQDISEINSSDEIRSRIERNNSEIRDLQCRLEALQARNELLSSQLEKAIVEEKKKSACELAEYLLNTGLKLDEVREKLGL